MSDLDTRIMEQLKKATREQKLQVLEWLNEVVGPANKAPTIFKQKEDKGVFNITELADDGFSDDTDGDGVEDDKNTEDIDDEIEESIEGEDDTDFDIEPEDEEDSEEESDEIDDDEIDDIDLEDDEDDEEPVKKVKSKAKKKVDEEDFETEDEEESEDNEDPDDDTTDDDYGEEDPEDDTTDDIDDEEDEEPVKKKGKQVKAKKVKFDEDDYDTWTADTIKQVKSYIKKTWGVNPNQFKGKDGKVADQLIDVDDDILTQQEKWEKMKLNKLESLCKKEGIKIKGRTEKAKKENAVEQLTANYIEENY